MMPVADATSAFTESLNELSAMMERTLVARIDKTEQSLSEHLTETVQRCERTFTERLERISGNQVNATDLAVLTALPAQVERQLRSLVQEVKAELQAAPTRPKLSLVGASPNISANTSESGIDKATFVRSCLTEHPEMRNTDIQRKASEQGVNISPAYISELRKAWTPEQSA